MNVAIISGRLVKDPTWKDVAESGVCEFRLAVESRKRVAYISVEAWGKLGQTTAEFCVKGQMVEVVGEISFDEWRTEAGELRSKTYVTARSIEWGKKPYKAEESPAADREEVAA